MRRNILHLIDHLYALVISGQIAQPANQDSIIHDVIQLHHLAHLHENSHATPPHSLSSIPLAEELKTRILSNIHPYHHK